jgi:methylthioribose-1-phosphate isomerase
MKLADIHDAVLAWGPVSKEGLVLLAKERSLVVVPEQRPSLCGLKHTLPLCHREKIASFCCADNALGILFYKNKIKKTFIFYKEKTEEGIHCSSGTLYAALLSKIHGVPISLHLQGDFSLETCDKDARTLGGRDFLLPDVSKMCIIEPDIELLSSEVTG